MPFDSFMQSVYSVLNIGFIIATALIMLVAWCYWTMPLHLVARYRSRLAGITAPFPLIIKVFIVTATGSCLFTAGKILPIKSCLFMLMAMASLWLAKSIIRRRLREADNLYS